MRVKIISNTCVGSEVYSRFGKPYTTPLVGSIFLNDNMYLKFMKNLGHYTTLTPTFKIADQNEFLPGLKNIHPKYPLMLLEDVHIHWIHEDKTEVVLEKWNRRLERGKDLEPVFTWSASEFMSEKNDKERAHFINEVCELPHLSLFFTERPAESKKGENFIIHHITEFQDKKQDDRYQWHFLRWNKQFAITNAIINILKEKNMEW